MNREFYILIEGYDPKDFDRPPYWNEDLGGVLEKKDATVFSFEDLTTDHKVTGGVWVTERKRFADAIHITDGAVNLKAIALSVSRAVEECRGEGVKPSECPAIFLMVEQMRHLTSTDSEGKARSTTGIALTDFIKAIEACRENIGTVAPVTSPIRWSCA